MIDYAEEQYPDLFDDDIEYITDEVSYNTDRVKRYTAL